ncbi:MAG: GTP cyclohydrolase II [Formivibrio sp.]|nr:GTP cyclohydrolase II [Formivibrio sp.]
MNSFLESANCSLTTEYGNFTLHGFRDKRSGLEHAALSLGELSTTKPVLTRLHSECLTGDVFHSLHCDCGEQLQAALELIEAEGCGVLLYLRQEGRGIGLLNKIRAYKLQQKGADTVDANRMLGLPDDARDYGVAAEMLASLGVTNVRLMTNNPAKIKGLMEHGIRVEERMPLEVARQARNAAYLDTKAARMGHLVASVEVTSTQSATSSNSTTDLLDPR